MVGQTIAHYTITEKIGKGGMGEVYRATDTRLKRDVALKVLPETFTQDPQRLARFQREAETLASLNHPNIGSIYGLEKSGKSQVLVLELIEGADLSERISKGRIPLIEALEITLKIAAALEAAHEKGIIHRDLKPANVRITPEGEVKVLDFGLAKGIESSIAFEASLSQSPTLALATQAGFILGTAAYMSPEQARGKEVDKRADIWALGVVLHEMLAGQLPFEGSDVTEVLAAVIKDEPKVDLLAEVPGPIQRLVSRCLRKDPRQRIRDAGDVRIMIEDFLALPTDSEPVGPTRGKSPARVFSWKLFASMAVLLFIAVVATWSLKPSREDRRIPLRKYEIPVDNLNSSTFAQPQISPDGRRIACRADLGLLVRQLDQLESRRLPGTEGATFFFWSPESDRIAFVRAAKLWIVGIDGGTPTSIAALPGDIGATGGGAWRSDGAILISGSNTAGLLEVSDQGGDPRTVLANDPTSQEEDFHEISLLPDNKGVLLSVDRTPGSDTLALFANGRRKDLLKTEGENFHSPVYSPSGHVLYHRSTGNPGVWAVPFSLDRLEVSGEPFLVASNASQPSAALDGTLAYVSRGVGDQTQLFRVDRSGRTLGAIGQPQIKMTGPAVSSDGTQVAVSALENGNRDIWIHDIATGAKRRLTFAIGDEEWPSWSADGKELAFVSIEGGFSRIMVRRADASEEAKAIAEGERPNFSSDGSRLVYSRTDAKGNRDLWTVSKEDASSARVFLESPHREDYPFLSPDGRFVAYVSSETGRQEVYVRSFPGGEENVRVSVNGGQQPRWSSDGNELFYYDVGESGLVAVAIQTRPVLSPGFASPLFADQTSIFLGYSVEPGGANLILARPASGGGSTSSIVVIQNWNAEFERRD